MCIEVSSSRVHVKAVKQISSFLLKTRKLCNRLAMYSADMHVCKGDDDDDDDDAAGTYVRI